MNHSALTTAALAVLTCLSTAGFIAAVFRFRQPGEAKGLKKLEYSLLGLTVLGSAAVFVGRAVFVTHSWQPLQSHVDGLLLIVVIFSMLVPFLESRAKLSGISLFALPLISLILAMAFVGYRYRYEPFAIGPAWRTMHLIGVYLGTLFFALGAIAGGMYLYVQKKLRTKKDIRGLSRLASLEAIESLIVRTSALGFGLLTVGLIGGVVELTKVESNLIVGWWYQPKVVLSFVVWLLYAVVMNVRHSATFRGKRAAYMCIAGLVLVMVTFALVSALPPLVKHVDKDGATKTTGIESRSNDQQSVTGEVV